MTNPGPVPFDPTLDLRFERVVEVPPEALWKGWTRPELLVRWFTPAPWRTLDAEVDLRPGGSFRTTMASPEGQEFPMAGCYLEVVENRRLAWTQCLGPGFRPAATGDMGPMLTAILTFEPEGAGTRYTAVALHKDAKDRAAHEAMGFQEGWGKALDQLVELVKG